LIDPAGKIVGRYSEGEFAALDAKLQEALK
jgi:hypothetical protein